MTKNLIDNMTAAGPSLRELIEELTGCDPLTTADFAWSNALYCDVCGVGDSTAVVSVDGDDFRRLCFHCLGDAL